MLYNGIAYRNNKDANDDVKRACQSIVGLHI